MSATVANDRVYRAFLGEDLSERTFYHGHSYGGNALAAAVALRHLQLIHSRAILDNVRARSAQLRNALQPLRQRSAVRDIRLVGLMGAVELDTSENPLLTRRVCAAMVRRGVLSRSMGPVVTLVPLLTATAEHIDRIVATLTEALDEVAA
jgi:adenosylmethionine-8-amino-7-oxononanoate aminotransferase